MIGVSSNLAYVVLFLLILGESAGIPLPGETGLIAASAMAAQGQLDLPLVLAAALSAAILGDNLGYLVGRHAGQRLLTARGPLSTHRARLLATGDAFFDRHGAMAVFLGRWTPLLRVTAALLAGTHKMAWRRFLVWNALGGAGWAATVGLLAYALGGRVPGGVFGVGVVLTTVGLVTVALRVVYRRAGRRRAPAAQRVRHVRPRLDTLIRIAGTAIPSSRIGQMPRAGFRLLRGLTAVAAISVLVVAGTAWIDVL